MMIHNLGFPISPFKSGYIRVNIRNLSTFQTNMNNASYTFIDVFARYRLNKWKTDFELDMSNLTNIKNYRTYMTTANMISQNEFELRGRTILLRAVFNL
ncbi:TonB dependent receptor [compost metagenome]